MSTEQIARDFIANMTNVAKIKSMVTADAMASGGVLPQAIPLLDSVTVINGLTAALPDFKMDVQEVAVNGNQATVKVYWGGTNTGPLNLPIPGLPAIPPTGKKVWAKDAYILTVQGDKVSHFEVISPADGGIPAMLAQLGVKVPGM